MTTPASSGGRSPLRIGGIALLAVGVIAALIGAVTLATSGNGTVTAAPPPVTATVEPTPAPPTTEPAPAPTSAAAVPVPSFTPTAPPAALPTPPPPGATAPKDGNAPKDAAEAPKAAAPAAPAGPVERAPLRIYSNGTIQGMAGHAADDFKKAGWQVDRVDNYSSGVIPTSTAYFRPGTPEQAAAQSLGNEFGLRVEPRFAGLTEASPGVIVIITNDYRRR